MAAVESAAQVAAPVAEVPELAQQGQAQAGDVEGLAQGMEGMHVEQGQLPVPELELHRACAEGNFDGVRACLTASLEALETLDMSTGCTPIVLAIRNSHYDVVRELLSAGAIVPPPGLTNDPGMLSILYPPHMYGMPPFMQGPPEFFPQSSGGPMYGQQAGQGGPQGGFYPQDRMYEQGPFGPGPQGQMHPHSHQHQQPPFHGQVHGHGYGQPHGGRDRKGSRSEVAGQLPPMEVAKMIPCRNFPQCKYGNSCAFYHPNRPPYFAPGPGGPYEQYPAGFNGYAQDGAGSQEVIPEGQEGAEGSATAPAQVAEGQEGEASAPSADQVPSQSFNTFQPNQPAFVPMSNRRQSFNQFVQPGMPMPMQGKSYGHGKKPSFSGGPRPFAPRQSGAGEFGKWKDGMPPPCVFFGQGKCRNGEMCKFPHIDAEGNDLRHPDVIKGLIAPVPGNRRPRTSFGYPPSGPAPMNPNAAFDPAQRSNQLAFLQQQRAAVQQNQAAGSGSGSGSASSGSATPAIPTAPGPPVQSVSTSESTETAEGQSAPSHTSSPSDGTDGTTTIGDSQTLVASTPDLASAKEDQVAQTTTATVPAPAQAPVAANLPAKPATNSSLAPAVARSASQPGIPRPGQVNGGRGPFAHPNARRPGPGRPFVNGNANVNGRSASTEGHVRQNGVHASARGSQVNGNANSGVNGQNGSANGSGNGKAAAAATRQRVPGADDFPSLGGKGNSSSKQTSPVAPGRTAAQVLSAPAPEKPKEDFRPKEKEVQEKEGKKEESKNVKTDAADEDITMDSDNESDGVIITCKPSNGNTAPVSGNASPVKKAAPLSFASIAGALSGKSTDVSSPAQADAAPVAVKA